MLGRPALGFLAAAGVALCFVTGAGSTADAAQGELASAMLERMKAATAYLELRNGGGSGTAFCISSDGYFVTCAHVVAGLKNGDEVDLILNSGSGKEQKIKAAVSRVDPDHDVAVLKSGPVTVPALAFTNGPELKETDKVVAAGYPFGRGVSTRGAAPEITITTGSITAVRREDKVPTVLQMDADLNPGNSGGPVVDLSGRVVGVASSKITGTRMNFAVSVSWVTGLIATPGITLTPPGPIAAERANQLLTIPLRLDYLRPPAQSPQVKAWFEVTGGKSVQAQVVAKSGGAFEIRGAPVSSQDELSGNMLRLEFVNTVGSVRLSQTCRVPDAQVKIGSTSVPLSMLSLIYPKGALARKNDGTELKGALSDLNQVHTVEGYELPDPMNSEMLVIRPEGSIQANVICRVEVTAGSFTRTLRMPLTIGKSKLSNVSLGNPALPAFSYGAGDHVPAFAGESIDIDLGGVADAFAWGGGGRYLVARLPKDMRLLVVDCLAGKTVGFLPLPNASAAFTAGGLDLLIANDAAVSRYSLADLSPQPCQIKLPGGKVELLGMGCGWSRQAVVFSSLMGNESQPRLELRDVRDGRVLAIEPMNANSLSGAKALNTAAFERALVINQSTLKLRDGSLQALNMNSSAAWLDAAGVWSVTAQGMVSPIGDPAWSRQRGGPPSIVIPTTVPGLAVRLKDAADSGYGSGRGSHGPQLDVVDLSRSLCLLSQAVTLDEAAQSGGFTRVGASVENSGYPQKVNLAPQFGLLATVSWNSASVRVRKFDLWKKLNEAGADYLYVTEPAPDVIAAGSPFQCSLAPRSSSPEVRATLVQGPPGLAVDGDGTLRWSVPQAGQGGPVIVRFATPDGHDLMWSHDLWVR